MKVGLHQGSSLCPNLFDMIMNVTTQEAKDIPPLCMLFVDDIIQFKVHQGMVEQCLEAWRKAMEERGLKISRKEAEYFTFNEEIARDIKLQGTNSSR